MDIDKISYMSPRMAKRRLKLKEAMEDIKPVGYLKPKRNIKREGAVRLKRFGEKAGKSTKSILESAIGNFAHNAVKLHKKESKYQYRFRFPV